jgi:hypothetical protein
MDDKYLQRYAEPEAHDTLQAPPGQHHQHCLVIPAYRESPALVNKLLELGQRQNHLLIILVLNHPSPETSADPNRGLRQQLNQLPAAGTASSGQLYGLTDTSQLLLVERPQGLAPDEGVGLARKIGCDIALALYRAGQLGSHWINTTDADTWLPAGYFTGQDRASPAVAITHPFRHRPADNPVTDLAMSLYDLRLHYYVLGLQFVGSGYAFHTIGSCISVTCEAYAAVRGFPRRSAGEDFYLLNKVAKLGRIAKPQGPVIDIDARLSDRVPFGTGPAVASLAVAESPLSATLFYNPDSFLALKTTLEVLPLIYQADSLEPLRQTHSAAAQVLADLNVEKALRHCRKSSSDYDNWHKHFSNWFDGFRTLKFIHGMRASGLPDLSLQQSREHRHSIWPGDYSFPEL